MDTARLEAKIREFLRDELGLDDGEFQPNTSLVTSGLVDSAGLVRLAAVLEREAGIAIPDRDVNSEHFDSIERILSYLRARATA